MNFLSKLKSLLNYLFSFTTYFGKEPVSNKRLSKRAYGRMSESAVDKYKKSLERKSYMEQLGSFFNGLLRKKGPREAKNFIGTRRMKPGMYVWKLRVTPDENGERFFVPERIEFEADRVEEKVVRKNPKGVADVTLKNKVMSVHMEEGYKYCIARNEKNACRKFARMLVPVQDSKGQTYFIAPNEHGHTSVKAMTLDPNMVALLKGDKPTS